MENKIVELGTDLAVTAAVVIAIVDAVKQVLPEQVHGIVTIVIAVLVGWLLTLITLPAGVVAALVGVGVISTAKHV